MGSLRRSQGLSACHEQELPRHDTVILDERVPHGKLFAACNEPRWTNFVDRPREKRWKLIVSPVTEKDIEPRRIKALLNSRSKASEKHAASTPPPSLLPKPRHAPPIQILTASMLDVSGAVLDWHTGDAKYDYLVPNAETCPRLAELSEEALTDPSWTTL